MKKEIYIRPLVETDALTSFKWRNDPEIWKYTGNKPDVHVTEEVELNWIKNVLQRKNETRFAICINGTDEYIGNVQLTNINEYEGEFHIFIGEKRFWGGGYGVKATALLVEYAFTQLGLQCVYLYVKKQNVAAVNAYKKAGFYEVIDDEEGNIRMAVYACDKHEKTVSVFMMAYNHGELIEQALEGIINQKRNFQLEIVIGEDGSTDQTRAAVLKYALKHPNLLKLILHNKNIGASKNQVAVLNSCKGKYIAICEGDDYWIDENKLQKQVDFMEANPNYSVCFHQVYLLKDNKDLVLSDLIKSTREETFTILDLAKGNFIQTPSVLFRNRAIEEYPEWFIRSVVGDYVLHMLNAKRGLIKYFPEPMAVYRIHDKGTWQSRSRKEQIEKFSHVVELLLNEFSNDDQVVANLKYQHAVYMSSLADSYYQENDFDNYQLYLKKAFDISPLFMKDWLVETNAKYKRVANSKAFEIGRSITGNAFVKGIAGLFRKGTNNRN